MLTVDCPNCRHRFPYLRGCTGGCTSISTTTMTPATTTTTVSFDHHLPTSASGGFVFINTSNVAVNLHRQHQVTISTTHYDTASCAADNGKGPQSNVNGDSSMMVPKVEVMSKYSGGGCVIQNSFHEPACEKPLLDAGELKKSLEKAAEYRRIFAKSGASKLNSPPSGCQELPGTRRESSDSCDFGCLHKCNNPFCTCSDTNEVCPRYPGCKRNNSNNSSLGNNSNSSPVQSDVDESFFPQSSTGSCRSFSQNQHHFENSTYNKFMQNTRLQPQDVQIQLNATVRIPGQDKNKGHCTLSITASTSSPGPSQNSPSVSISQSMNNFNGGGIVGLDLDTYGIISNCNSGNNSMEETSSPVSWISCSHVPYVTTERKTLTEKDITKLTEVKARLQMSGWYYDDMSWQQSASLLNEEPVGTWLMRDSSDERYAFAVSVKTPRGPTSIRVIYTSGGQFHLDAQPSLAHNMPHFDCPISLMEHYVEYSKNIRDEPQRQIWVDCFGVKFTKIYLSEPLVKEVRSLQHLARLKINKNKDLMDKRIESLASSHKQFLAEYPYTL